MTPMRLAPVQVFAWLAFLGCDKGTEPPRPSQENPTQSQGAAPGEPGTLGATPGEDNPHAGGMPMDEIHAGMKMPTPPPGDPTQFLAGTIVVSPKLKDQVKPGDILFLSAKRLEADGTVQKSIAVDRLEVAALPVPFKLTSQNMMMEGTRFEGRVRLVARVDRDGEAMSRVAGDLEGTLDATIPAGDLELVLDTVVP